MRWVLAGSTLLFVIVLCLPDLGFKRKHILIPVVYDMNLKLQVSIYLVQTVIK